MNHQPSAIRHRFCAFTLIELLVVVAIIAVLAAILLPALQQAKESSRRSVCMSNLRQLGIAMLSYADDNNGWLPTPTLPGWWDATFGATPQRWPLYADNSVFQETRLYYMLQSYIAGNGQLFYCPSQRFQFPGASGEFVYATRFPLVANTNVDSMAVIQYSGNIHGKLAENPRVRGSYLFYGFQGIPTWPESQQGPNELLLFDAGTGCAGCTYRANHQARMREVGKNTLFVDGSVRWMQFNDWKWVP
jgi:prepilin-type N-terminal cleavage/methylation domain-containing protein/prepilin-type processing-associated H-X9-DG protein